MMKPSAAAALVAALLAAGVVDAERAVFEPTTISAPFLEQFTADWSERWSASSATKEQAQGEVFSYIGQWAVEEPSVFPGLAGDAALVAKSKAAQHAISAPFAAPLDVAAAMKQGKPLVVQYETKMQKGLSCGGAYLKLLTESPEGIQAKEFSDKTPYTIMFGPDKCGATNKVHFIFRHTHPLTGAIEEKHLTSPPYPKISKTSALYTLVVRADQTYDIRINGESRKTGSLLEDFEPPVNPPKEIDDPEDSKPADWVDAQRIPDPAATKPDDWDEDAPAAIPDEDAVKPEGWLDDEPDVVPDPDAVKPEEWDDEEDGAWTAPLVPNPACLSAPGCGAWVRPSKANPAYKGKWSAPYVDNPAFKGEWAPRKIANPDYSEDLTPSHFSSIGGIGFELWTMDEDLAFDNIYVGHSEEDAKQLADETWARKLPIEQGKEKKEEESAAEKAKEAAKATAEGAVPLFDQLRERLLEFVSALGEDPLAALKAHPDVAGAVGALFAGLLAIVSLIAGVGSGASKPAPKAKGAKKTDAPSSKAKATAVKEPTEAKKRTPVAATVEDE